MQADGSHSAMSREKHRVALGSLLAAVLLTAIKLAVGLATNSLGILAEAVHSAFDLMAAATTLWAVRISGLPADSEHTYGHGKVENLSALFETLLLVATCAWIVHEAVGRLVFHQAVAVQANLWAFLVVIVSIVVDVTRSRALNRVAHKYHSQALEADALHFSTDIWSSAVVLVGLGGVVLSGWLGIPWLLHADAVAALGVAAIVVLVSLRLGKQAVDELLDRVPVHLQKELTSAAAGVPGVEQVKQVRVRRSGPDVFTDVTLTVDQTSGLLGAHDVADRAESALRAIVPAADVVVHVEPVAKENPDLLNTVAVLAARLGLSAHGLRAFQEEGRQCLELHLEVAPALRLEEAHRQATQLEAALRESLPELGRIVTHIEPATQSTAAPVEAHPVAQHDSRETLVRRALGEFFAREDRLAGLHRLVVQLVAGELSVSLHCRLDPNMAIVEAHEITRRLELHLRQRVPGLGRVTVHVEPAKAM